MSVPYFDAHCDTVTRFHSLRSAGTHLDLNRMELCFEPRAQVFALWAYPGLDRPFTLRRLMSRLERELARNDDILTLCRSAEEIRAAARGGRTAALIGVEGASLLRCSVAELTEAYRRGVRVVTLCWNRDNLLCGSAMDSGSGLTRAGENFAAACWNLGVAVDLSHASEKTFWDVLHIAKRPVFCSHSNAKDVCGHPRNLTDAQITALIENGGCMGLNLCPDFVGGSRDMDALYAHIDHVLSLGGSGCLCLGGDLDGVDRLPAGFTGVESMADFHEYLLRRGLSGQLLRDIYWNNLMRFMEEAL